MFNLAHTSTGELKTKSGAYKVETSNHYEERLGFHEVGFLTVKIGDGEFFFLFGSVLNGENEEKKTLMFCFAPFFSHVGRLVGVLHGKGRTFFTLKNKSAKSAGRPKYFWE